MTTDARPVAAAGTTTHASPATTDAAPANTVEAGLLTRVLGALLREDVVGLRSRGTLVHRADGPWLRLPAVDDALLLPVTEDGFQSPYAAREPLLLRESDGTRLGTCEAVLAALRSLAEPVDRAGFDAFAEECRQTLATMLLHEETEEETAAGLVDLYGADPADWT